MINAIFSSFMDPLTMNVFVGDTHVYFLVHISGTFILVALNCKILYETPSNDT
jgi:hypothetical protein